jgi:hypothetical protein
MTRKFLTRLALIGFIGFLCLPVLQRFSGLIPERPLKGVEEPKEPPVPTWRAWWRGRFQERFEKDFDIRLGLRSWFVRTDNQINLTLYRQTQWTMKTQVVLGKDDFLYERDYVKRYRHPPSPSLPEKIRKVARRMKRLQDRLAARGIPLLVVIAPSKAEVYPENVPDRFRRLPEHELGGDYGPLSEAFHEVGVNLVDAREMFRREREKSPTLLFSRGGTHWNHYGASLVMAEIMRRLGELSGRDLPELFCTGSRTDDEVWRADNDLGDILNVWQRERFVRPQTHAVCTTRPAAGGFRPDILLVGDSFSQTLTALMEENELVRDKEILYYFTRRLDYPGTLSEAFDPAAFNVLDALRGRDAVIIETNEYWFPNAGFGFVEKALDELKAERDEKRSDRPAGRTDGSRPGAGNGPGA